MVEGFSRKRGVANGSNHKQKNYNGSRDKYGKENSRFPAFCCVVCAHKLKPSIKMSSGLHTTFRCLPLSIRRYVGLEVICPKKTANSTMVCRTRATLWCVWQREPAYNGACCCRLSLLSRFMSITCFDDLVNVAKEQSDPQRLLFVFTMVEEPEEMNARNRQAYEQGAGGNLIPMACVDKALDELASGFPQLCEEAHAVVPDWTLVFAAAIGGSQGHAP